ncbi:hypothetical protein OSB04_un000351 [Centaurea solstitialis]|uniref:Reverse transcriptase zinc-binding domain-containing protein n=1 Tax=Centaurea solstitialis TaxID=347529 RepID=A0AA38SHW4_9ASTR|nr:hypothetical protein OSB04_un000351 [Centaurea solstitialis]
MISNSERHLNIIRPPGSGIRNTRSGEIWRKVKREVSLHGFPESWTLIMEMLNEGRGPVKLIQRLALAATIYFIWEERNNRLFNKTKKIGVQRVIMERMAYRSSLLMISR